MSVLKDMGVVIDSSEKEEWAAHVQDFQDLGNKWSEAIEWADEEYDE